MTAVVQTVRVPRYTSYPAYPYWRGIDQKAWDEKFSLKLSTGHQKVSLYIHVPFCNSLCTFCGCTKIITRDRSWADVYQVALLKEFDSKFKDIKENYEVNEIHVGGGSPTWLHAQEFYSLFAALLEKIPQKSENFSFSVEVDPRTLTPEHVEVFSKLGINRVSLGVQDFNPQTMEAISRKQSIEMVRSAVENLRRHNIEDINFDLVYGLPYQSLETMKVTLDEVLDLKPRQIAFYSYAHVPQLKVAQKILEKKDLPDMETKVKLNKFAREFFLENGYFEVGFDHFVLPESALYKATVKNSLHRNFMGYVSTAADLLIGLGPSSLSDCGTAYMQNEKNPSQWVEKLNKGESIITFGHLMSDSDIKIKNIVLEIMCKLSSVIDIDLWNDLKIQKNIDRYVVDEWVEWNPQERVLTVTGKGRVHVREIAACFDPYLANANLKFAD